MNTSLSNILASPQMLLRIGGGVCFIGHGVLAINGKAGFINLLNTFGLEPEQAIFALKLIGCLDVLVGLFILFRPNKLVLRWAMMWTALTITAWGIHGDSMMDLARRATYMTTPAALLFFNTRRENGQHQPAAVIKLENKMEDEENEGSQKVQVTVKKGRAAIERMDLTMICMKMMKETEGEGWNNDQCAEVAEEYRRYLTLRLLYPNEAIVPNKAIDTMWHYHILDTAAYERDCKAIFGKLLHHYPYFGIGGGDAEQKEFIDTFAKTKALYEQTFGESMDRQDYFAAFK